MGNNPILSFGALVSTIILITASCSQEPGTSQGGRPNAGQKPEAGQGQMPDAEAGGELPEVSTAVSIGDNLREAEKRYPEEHGSPLYKAITAGDVDLVRRLAQPEDVNKKGLDGFRPLGRALQSPKAGELVPILLEAGADPTLPEMSGMTALHLAVVFNKGEVLPLLLRNVSKIEIEDGRGITPLEYAREFHLHDIAALLEEKGRELEGRR